EAAGRLPPVDLWDRDVHEDQVGMLLAGPGDALLAIARLEHVIADMVQDRPVDDEVVLVVFDEENGLLRGIVHGWIFHAGVPGLGGSATVYTNRADPGARRGRRSRALSGRGLGGLPLLEHLQVRGVARVHASLGVDDVDGVVDGDGGHAEARGDELELGLVRDDVSRGVDTGDVGLHRGADLDAVLLELDAPAGDGPEVRLEADERENGVDLEGELLVRAVVEDGDGANAVV